MKNTEYLSNGMGGIVLSAKEAQDVLRTSPAYEEYLSLTEDFRREILDIVRGAKGLKITYDPFFKHVFDPVLHGERLSRLPNQYIHRSSQKFDTGLELELLQEYIFIALDIFREITHNIDKELDAWLYFLSSDEPEDIKRVIEAYPAFLELYREIAEFQRRPEELIAMYNETLALFDKNTVELMIEEQQEEIKKLAEEVRNKKAELEQSKTELEQSKADQREKDKELRKRDEAQARLRREIERLGGNTGE